MADELTGAVEALREDMAQHQRSVGREVTDSVNQALAINAIIELEKNQSDAKPQQAQAPLQPPTLSTVEYREINGKKYTVDKSTVPERPFRNATEFEANVMTHAMPRVQHLLTQFETGALGQASWRDRTIAAMYFKIKQIEARQSMRFDLAEEFEKRFMQDLYDLLEESNKVFGDWRKDAPEKLIVGA